MKWEGGRKGCVWGESIILKKPARRGINNIMLQGHPGVARAKLIVRSASFLSILPISITQRRSIRSLGELSLHVPTFVLLYTQQDYQHHQEQQYYPYID